MGACPESRERTESPAEVLRALREQTRRWRQQEQLRPRLSSGLPALDTWLEGGWPVGKVAELVGDPSAGRTTAAAATVAAATRRGEVAAWIDTADALDPASLAAAGADLRRVLWVRSATPEQAVRAAELVLEAGGFTVVVMDLARIWPQGSGEQTGGGVRWSVVGEQRFDHSSVYRSPTTHHRRGGWRALVLRLVRAVEGARVVALVLAEQPWTGGLAGVTVHLQRGGARWLGGARHGPKWFVGVPLRPVGQGTPVGWVGRGEP